MPTLQPGHTLATFAAVLGQPYASASRRDADGQHRVTHRFRTPDVDATVVTSDDRVEVRWFRIARRGKFAPTLHLTPGMEPIPLTVRLGRTTFLELHHRHGFPQDSDWMLGASTVHYRELWYFGRPAGYRYFVFDAGSDISLEAIAFLSEHPTSRASDEAGTASSEDPATSASDDALASLHVAGYAVVAADLLRPLEEWADRIPAPIE